MKLLHIHRNTACSRFLKLIFFSKMKLCGIADIVIPIIIIINLYHIILMLLTYMLID